MFRQGFSLVSSGPEIRPLSQWDLGDFFPNLKKNSQGLNKIYVWFLLPSYPIFFNPTLNIKMVFEEKIPKMSTFSDFVTIFFVKCNNKI